MNMTKTEAITFINEIEQYCKEKGDNLTWFLVTKEHRPSLTKIIIEISIKVDPDKNEAYNY